MALNNLSDGMGKKIVEALKMQSAEHSEGEVFINENNDEIVEASAESPVNIVPDDTLTVEEPQPQPSLETPQPAFQSEIQQKVQSQLEEQNRQMQINSMISPSFVDSAFQQSLARNLGTSAIDTMPDDFDYPANVAVLKQLIAKLPTGVSKQTGALIIKQTMEALGISMGSLLQEAKQVQEALSNSSKECRNNIVEYRKQIGILETKAQQYQHQSAVMNDIINLFLQTSK